MNTKITKKRSGPDSDYKPKAGFVQLAKLTTPNAKSKQRTVPENKKITGDIFFAGAFCAPDPSELPRPPARWLVGASWKHKTESR